MRDPRLAKMAEVLVRFSTAVRPGDLVVITSEPAAMDAVEAVFEQVLLAGGHPSFHPRSDALHELLLEHGNGRQLQHVCPFERHRLSTCDVLIVLRHPLNTRFLSRIDAGRVAMAQAARRGLLTMSLQRKAAGASRYVLAELPTAAAAQDAEMSLSAYEDWVFRAGFLDQPDAVGAWNALKERQERACERLRTARELRFVVPASRGGGGAVMHEGTDLVVDVSGMTWINCAGAENFPDGEVFTGPRAVDGVVSFNFPAVYRGVEVEGVRLKFRAGRVAEASARKNEQYLIRMLDQDEGARNAGEIALGTNYRIKEFSKNAFFDEKIGGTFHVALGAGYPESGNANESALHWDMVCDLRSGGEVRCDGEVIQRDGRFLGEGWPG